MLEQFLNHIREHRLCGPTDRILLAVSGGIDSIAMLRLFHEAGQSIAVVHCNFQSMDHPELVEHHHLPIIPSL